MPTSLSREQRNLLSRITLEARDAAETAARAALENLAVHEKEFRAHMSVDQRLLSNRLRARGRALGDRRDPASGVQDIRQLAESVAYEHWHRLLFTRFLAENHLLRTDAANGNVPVTLDDCEELAPELDARDGFELACRFAWETLPGIFRPDDPALALRLAPNHEVQLRKLLDRLPAELFRADDALGWTYQFWQARRKDEVNKSGVKIGADELPAVTQLFTEDYMVEFLLHNSLGAWWAGRCAAVDSGRLSAISCPTEAHARRAVALPAKDGLPGIDWTYLRFVQPTEDGDSQDESSASSNHYPLAPDHYWLPAAGTFDGWPKTAAAIRFLDPCMGSGHFLVFALPILARLRMEEEGLDAARAVAAVIRDNLHGLELDERCTQIAAFNLALTAWKLGGWQILPPLHLACSGLAPHAAEKDWIALAGDNDKLQRGMERLYRLFNDAPVLGSLINPRTAGDLIDADFHELQPLLAEALKAEKVRDDEGREMGVVAEGLAKAAEILAARFTLVATNVPYLARGKQGEILKQYCKRYYSVAKNDIANVFLERCLKFAESASDPGDSIGAVQVVMPQNWLFLGSYRKQRERLLREVSWNLLGRLGPGAFETISGEVVNAILLTLANTPAPDGFPLSGVDASGPRGVDGKAAMLRDGEVAQVDQAGQLGNPDARVILGNVSEGQLLARIADYGKGSTSGDSPRFLRGFWELPCLTDRNLPWLDSPNSESLWAGREHVTTTTLDDAALTEQLGCRIHGQDVWGRRGVAVNKMRALQSLLYAGEVFDDNICPIAPQNPAQILPILAFVQATDFKNSVRQIDQKLNVTAATLVKVPFDLEYWQKIAAEKYPNGLPKLHSDDPTQWLFNGHPKGSEQPLHVAVARLLGYRWPRQTGSEFPDCPALGPDGLEEHSDPDGIVCLPPLNREQPAAARLRALLAAALGSGGVNAALDEAALLAATGAKSKTLEDWLRDEFFEQHCKLFHQRPFVWHIWDGRKDGFHALVNYHRLDHATLQKLTYSYLGDWIRQQDADAKADKPGAAERLGAARALEAELENILEGEAHGPGQPSYDIFIRWKPLKEQPMGWNPDLNDGVRLNIRPFLSAKDVGKKGAGILRAKPNIKWDKDRGKEPLRDQADFPWFWHDTEPPTDCKAGPEFTGHRWNDVHFTLARKKAARDNGD